MARKPKQKETTGEAIRSFIFAVLIALLFRSVAYEPFHIPSGSMLSTLYEGDYIFVSKLSYGYSRYSFPFSLPLFQGRIFETPPKRGDVVVFRLPPQPSIDYIKRVIGLPGDTIQVTNGRLIINGTPVEVTRRGDVEVPDDRGSTRVLAKFDETLPGGRTHIILNERNGNRDYRTGFDSDNTGIYTVPPGHYFMMGDNRDNSEDSRYGETQGYAMGPGFVPEENLIGRAEIVLLSYDTSVPFWKFWQWPHAFRGTRFLQTV